MVTGVPWHEVSVTHGRHDRNKLTNIYLTRTDTHILSVLRAAGVLLLTLALPLCLASTSTQGADLQADINPANYGGEVRVSSVSYTAANQQSSYSPPVAGGSAAGTTSNPTQFTYNLDQQLTQIIQPGGVTVSFGYDSAGRPSTITHNLGSVSIAYAPVMDHIAQIGSSDGVSITYGYDGPLITDTSWSGVISGTVHRTFNSDFNISSETVNGANSVSYAYNLDGQLTQTGALSATRNAQNGLLTGTILGSVTDTLGYNQFGEALTYSAAYNGSNLLVHANTRDNGGRITQRIEAVSGITHTFVYSYDLANRLTDVARDSVLLSQYSYSPNGNRTGYSGSSGTITATYDSQDRMLQYGNLSFAYTLNGELQNKIDVSTSQTTTYTYDVLSNLRAVTLPGGTQIDYVIDGNNRRVGKKVNGTPVQGFLYGDGLEPVAELDAFGNIASRFVYGAHANVPAYMARGGQTYSIISDNLGSPRLVVNTATAQVVQRMDYDEFGNVLTDTNPGFQPFGFAGGIYDRDTGLVRFGARDYDSLTGRWTSKDPLLFGGGSTNLYAYIDNDPINRVDPSGLDGYDIVKIVTSSPFSLILDISLDVTKKSEEETNELVRQEVEQRLKQEREASDLYNNTTFGPYDTPEQADLALQFLVAFLPKEDLAYSCKAQYKHSSVEGYSRHEYRSDRSIEIPTNEWADPSDRPRIFINIYPGKWR
jgi:RHS repeat-associated protein